MKRLCLTLAVLLVVASVPAPTMADGDGRPLADAGLDQAATVGTPVYLDGGGSLDPDGEIVEYHWSIRTPSGETIHPADPDAVTTQFVPEETGRYEVELTVTGDDGQTQSDTLYVDVEAQSDRPPSGTPPSGTPTESPTTETRSATEDQSTSTSSTTTEASGPDRTATPSDTSGNDGSGTTTISGDSPVFDTNEPPTGEISGPSSVTSGSEVTYTIAASDPDGRVAERWWLPTALSAGQASQSELRGTTRTLTVDGEPGTTTEVSAIVVDDDGATATISKTVEIVNTPPTASIEGDSTAVVNTTGEYRLTATDPDGEITSVSLTSGSDAVTPTEPMPWDGRTGSGEWTRSFRFTEIPTDDGTVTFEATVRDEHGGVTTVEKEVTVVGSQTGETYRPLAQSPPEILRLDATLEEGPDGINGRQVLFTAVATDEDSNRLTFDWRIGDVAQLQNTAGGQPVRANISYALENQQIEGNTVNVTLRVSDQNGKEDTVSEMFEIRRPNATGGVVGRGRPLQVTSVRGTTVYGKYHVKRSHAGEEVVLNFGDNHSETVTLGETNTHRFSHKYESGGRYAISVNPGWSPDVASIPVNVDQRTYTVWSYERKDRTVYRTEATESPGENWTRAGIAHVEREQVGVETMRTLADGARAVTSPGQEWERVGTTTEYHTERRTTESTSHPGGDWKLAERNVDQKREFDGWQYTTVPRRGLLGSDWEYAEAVPRAVERTETKRSADRPSGSGWSRSEKVGQTQTGYRTEWVDYRFHADFDWQYVGMDRYVSGYDVTTRCVDYFRLHGTRYCIETETERDPVYDYRYEYRVPEYDAVYEWERTVEETEYEYRYRAATYTTRAVHEYEKEVRVGTEYTEWRRPVIETTDVYRWKMTETTWETDSSFSKPMGDVRNLTRTVKECGTESEEPEKCEGEG